MLGQFRDFNDPHRFTLLRGFASMPARFAAATIDHFKQDVSPEFIAGFNSDLAPVFDRSGAQIQAVDDPLNRGVAGGFRRIRVKLRELSPERIPCA